MLYSAPLRLRIYRPPHPSPLPILVYFHGGGWVLGSLNAVDGICRYFAHHTPCIVVSVDYRLAPEHKFPTAVEDAYAATLWVSRNAEKLGGTASKIAVGGDSAGGNLAAVVTQMAKQRNALALVHSLLIYPVTDYNFESPSYCQYAQGYGLSREEMIWFWHHYLNHPSQGSLPFASPLQADSLEGLPSTSIITAEYDVLASEGQAYAQKLEEAGVKVFYRCYEGMIHSFVALPPCSTLGYPALQDLVKQLQMAFESNSC